ncbi:MAG: hypothetical protein LBR69_04350 [Endomicrobium sp.]|jgi:hypothetical protein|nr:hypothetical protein [Endomicrobium sp.]
MRNIVSNKITFFSAISLLSLLLTAFAYLFLTKIIDGYSNLPDFISGYTIWFNTNKIHDLLIPFIYTGIFFIIYFCIRGYIQKLPLSPLPEGNFIERVTNKFSDFILYKSGRLTLPGKTALIFAGIFIVYFFSAAEYDYSTIPADHLHFGEKLLGWWLASDPGSRIYETFYPIHNYKDIIPGFIGNLLGDNHTSGAIIGNILFYNLCLITASSAILIIFPFAMSLIILLPLRFITALPYIAMIILFKDDSVFKSYPKWLSFYCLFSVSLYCLEPTAGVPFALSLFPLCIYGLYVYYKGSNYRNFCLSIGLITAVAAIFFIIFREYFIHSFEVLFTFAKYNIVAFGQPGYRDFGSPIYSKIHFIFNLAYKSPVYFLFPVFILLFFKELKRKKMQAAFFLSAMLIFLIISINYALVRFDFEDMLRAHKLAMCFVYLLFPAFLYFNREQYKKLLNFYILFILLLLFFQTAFKFKYKEADYIHNYLQEPTFSFNVNALKNRFFVKNRTLEENDVFRQGYSRFIESDFKEILSIREFLYDTGFDDKSFFDFTNNTIFYYHFNKKPPFPFWTFNNIIDPETDFQYAKKIFTNLPDYVLIHSKYFLFDHFRPSVKTNAIYRTLILSGKYNLFGHNEQVFLVKNGNAFLSKTDIEMLDTVLGTKNLRYMPDSWGMSFNTLKNRLDELYPASQITHDGNKLIIVFDKPLSAKILDFILIDGKFNADYSVRVNNSFILSASRNKETSLVPLDVSPAYLLGGDVKEIAINFSDKDINHRIEGLKIKFYQKKRNKELNNMLIGSKPSL